MHRGDTKSVKVSRATWERIRAYSTKTGLKLQAIVTQACDAFLRGKAAR